MLLLEIGLTIAAWRKGWRGKALLPIVGTLALGLLLGIAVGLAGGTIEAAAPVAMLADLTAIGVLIAMIRRAPEAQAMIEERAVAGETA